MGRMHALKMLSATREGPAEAVVRSTQFST
jgi:hypothetical protein